MQKGEVIEKIWYRDPIFWKSSASDVSKTLGTDIDKGLSSKCAAERLNIYGKNVLKEEKVSKIKILLRQLYNPFSILLIVAAVLSLIVDTIRGEFPLDFYIILFVIVVQTLLGFVQEYKSEKTVELLKKMLEKKVRVIRDGQERIIPSSEVVPGDIIILREGEVVPADVRVIEENNLFVNESTITGESIPVKKVADPVDIGKFDIYKLKNILFQGTWIVEGWCKGIVIGTGTRTYLASIAKKAEEIREESTFEKDLERLGRRIIRFCILLIAIVTSAFILTGKDLVSSILFSIALAVSIVPESLPLIATIGYSIAARKLMDIGVLVKRLDKVCSFGNINVLCVDKTGTITEGKLRLVDADERCLELAYYTSIRPVNQIDEEILRAVQEKGISPAGRVISYEPFSRSKGYSKAVVEIKGKRLTVIKGSAENVAEILKDKEIISKAEEAYRQGYYAIAVGVVESGEWYIIKFMDPPRKETKKALYLAKNLGLEIKVITGDSASTTIQILKMAGFDIRSDEVLTGEEIDKMSYDDLKKAVQKVKLFARVRPEQKWKIVKALEECGYRVGVTGDGVNDILALKEADVGIAVSNAVDVAKEAASVVLLKDDLLTIVEGIMLGRKVFANMKKYLRYTLFGNVGDAIFFSVQPFFSSAIPLTASQILVINLLTDTPAIVISDDNVDREEVRKPQYINAREIEKEYYLFGFIDSWNDFILLALSKLVFKWSDLVFGVAWFFENITAEIMSLFVIRTRKIFWRSKPSKKLIITTIATFAIELLLAAYPQIIGLYPTGLFPVAFSIALGFIDPVVFVEFGKWVARRKIWERS